MAGADRKRAEQAPLSLEDELELFRMAEAAARVGHWYLRLADEMVYWSPEVFRIHGLEAESSWVPLEFAVSVYEPEDLEKVKASLDDAITANHSFAFMLRIRRPNGEMRHVHAEGRPKVDEHGDTIALAGTFRDVSDHVASEIALDRARETASEARHKGGENRKRLMALMSVAADWTWRIDRNFCLQERANYTEEGEEVPKGQVGRCIFELGPQIRGIDAEEMFDRLRRHEILRDVELQLYAADKQWHWMTASATPLHNDRGDFDGYYIAFRIIDDLKRTEEELRHNQRRMTALTGVASDWVWQTDRDFKYVFRAANTHLGQMLPKGSVGDNIVDARDRLRGEGVAEAFRAMERREAFRNLEGELLAADGQWHWINVSADPIIDDEGEFDGYYFSARVIDDQKRAEEALRKSEARYRAFVDVASDWVWELDADLRIVELSDNFERITGLPIAEGIGRTPFEYADFLRAGQADKFLEMFRRHEPIRDAEFELLCAGDVWRWVSLSANPIFGEHGKFLGYHIASGLIDDRKRAEEALLEAERRRQWMYEQTPLILHSINPQGVLVSVSDHWLERFGYSREEVIDRPFAAFLTPASREYMLKQSLPAFLENGEVSDIALQVITKRGEIVDILLNARAILNEDGNIEQSVAALSEVTALKRAQKAIGERDLRFRNLVEGSIQGIFIQTQDEIVFANQALADIFGYDSGNEVCALGTLEKLTAEWERPRLRDNAIRRWMGEEVPNRYELQGRRRDGGLIWVECMVHMIEWNGERALQGTIIDVTARKGAEEQARLAREHAEAASRSKSQFLAQMSHELRTPMTGVLGMADLLLRSDLTEKQEELATSLRGSADALLRILNDILDIAKIESGKLELEEINFDLAEVLDQVDEIFAPTLEKKGLELLRSVGDGVPSALKGDPTRLRQILFNLIGNAIKFTESGSVAIRVSQESRSDDPYTLRFEVVDTGIGIEPAVQRSLFRPFTQADRSTTRRYGGTGLGLTICKELVDRMNGEIGVVSRQKVGSTFWFTVSFQPAEGRESIEEIERISAISIDAEPDRIASTPAEETRGGLKVLLAEDHPVNRQLVEAILAEMVDTLDVAVDGVEAVEAARSRTYDLILMDIQMPRMDGIEATHKIRAEGASAKTPIIALTANALKGDAERYIREGMDGYVSKPVNIRMLLSSIAEVTGDPTISAVLAGEKGPKTLAAG